MGMSGDRFFYVNPLEVWPSTLDVRKDKESVLPERQKWFGCACCPPNIARLIASIGQYIYSHSENEIYIHLYTDNSVEMTLAGETVEVIQKTDYPWDGMVEISVHSSGRGVPFTMALRVPGWCNHVEIAVNGNPLSADGKIDSGYLKLRRQWQDP